MRHYYEPFRSFSYRRPTANPTHVLVKIFCATCLILPLSLSGSVPGLLHYQGYVEDGGVPMNSSVAMTLRLYDSAAGINLLYADSSGSVQVQNGVFNTFLGDDSIAGDLLTALNEPEVWLEIVVNGITLSPRQRVVSTPYSQLSGHADTADIATNASNADNADALDGIPSTGYLRRNIPTSTAVNASKAAAITVTQHGDDNAIEASTAAVSPGTAALHGTAGSVGPLINSAAGVFGTSSSNRGVVGSSNSSDGVVGYSDTGVGVNAQSTSGLGLRAFSSTGTALFVQGDSNMIGDLSVSGGLNNQMVPIALGFVNTNGTLNVGSSNVSSTFNSGRYEITISGYSYFFSEYVTLVTPTTAGYTARTSSLGGKLHVYLYNASGAAAQGPFQFVTYKP